MVCIASGQRTTFNKRRGRTFYGLGLELAAVTVHGTRKSLTADVIPWKDLDRYNLRMDISFAIVNSARRGSPRGRKTIH
jgi:hypothetical protein